MDESWKARWKPALVGIWHFLGALLIAYLFIIMLMAVSAQSRVADELARLKAPLDYSAGYGQWKQSLTIVHAIDQLTKARNGDARAMDAAVKALGDKTDLFLLASGQLQSLRIQLEGHADCDIPESQDPTIVALSLGILRTCQVAGSTLSAPLQDQIAVALKAEPTILNSARDLLNAQHKVDDLTQEMKTLDDTRQRLDADQVPLKEATGAFMDLAALEEHPWLGGVMLVSFPPSMMQIMLAFVSGMFGALLVTLVLIVYPQNNMTFTSTHASYEARIFLGGLISVCVFVMMGGGTAVLGSGSAFAGTNANFLAFCAVGLLAGMFSDRVAYWLSQRASALFKTDDAAQKAVEAAHASDAAKQAADTAAAANAEAAQAAAARAEAEKE